VLGTGWARVAFRRFERVRRRGVWRCSISSRRPSPRFWWPRSRRPGADLHRPDRRHVGGREARSPRNSSSTAGPRSRN